MVSHLAVTALIVCGPSALLWAQETQNQSTKPRTESETVIVKYRGPVSLAPFQCKTITRSSFINEVCYDKNNQYMLIQLNDIWYHYCDIDDDTVTELLDADSMGRYYNTAIKSRFDCRVGHIPQY
jgi:hypothetical protein